MWLLLILHGQIPSVLHDDAVVSLRFDFETLVSFNDIIRTGYR